MIINNTNNWAMQVIYIITILTGEPAPKRLMWLGRIDGAKFQTEVVW